MRDELVLPCGGYGDGYPAPWGADILVMCHRGDWGALSRILSWGWG